MKRAIQSFIANFNPRGLQVLFMGCVTGFLVGVIVTFYNILASIGEGFASNAYAYIRTHWFLIPLLLAVLAGSAFIVGVAVKLAPMLRGSGIPQTEGVARGIFKIKWFSLLCSKFALSLACIFLGLCAGGEGPSIQMGGALGYGSSKLFSRMDMLRRYQVTGGACAGLAVAFNAPLTGMAFAFEETHKKFSPEVFICAFSSVVTGVLTRNLIRAGLGLSTSAAFTSFAFLSLPYTAYGYLVLAALAVSLLGVGFYYLTFLLDKLVKEKLTFAKNTGKMLLPFLLAGVFGLTTVYATGGGHALIEALGTLGGTREMAVEQAFFLGLGGTIALALVFKLILTLLNIACGVPCGVFIPMLAVGAAAGALCSLFCTEFLGMDPSYSDIMTFICMAAFFTCVVRAPITGIVMVFELTWSFTALLPVVVGVAIGYMVGEIARTQPIYEVLLEQQTSEKEQTEVKQVLSFILPVRAQGIVDGLAIKDVLWPTGAMVKGILRGEERVTPTAETLLLAEDIITVEVQTSDGEGVEKELNLLTGNK